ncbi:MAG: hypothetical protein Q7U91_15880 [Sideroxyarcus sp.]|nr:hypothetical protein [Sideroxyarcus sp.]
MKSIAVYLNVIAGVLLVVLVFTGCSRETATEKDFAGKWKSSRLETPVFLYENGEWEIKTDSGAVLQYGLWRYENKRITWTYKINSQIENDVNAVVSLTPQEFHVRERDGTTTIFFRLDHN